VLDVSYVFGNQSVSRSESLLWLQARRSLDVASKNMLRLRVLSLTRFKSSHVVFIRTRLYTRPALCIVNLLLILLNLDTGPALCSSILKWLYTGPGTITVIYSKSKPPQVNSTSHVLPGKQRMTTPFDPHLYENHTFITDNVYKQIPLPKVKGQSTSKIIVIITYSMSYALPFRDVRNGKQF